MALFFVCLSLIFLLALVCYKLQKHHVKLMEEIANLQLESTILQVEQERLKTYRRVVDSSPHLFLMVDQALQIITSNPVASQFGWITSQSFLDGSIAPTSKLHFEFELREVLKTGAIMTGEIRLKRDEEGRWLFYHYQIFPIKDERCEVIGAVLSALDLTAQREAEESLDQHRIFLEGIMNAIPDPIYVKNDQLQWAYGNQAFTKLLGKKRSDYFGKTVSDIELDSRVRRIFKSDKEVFDENIIVEQEVEIEDTHSNIMTVLLKKVPVYFQNGQKVLISIMRDISDRKQLESELQISKANQQETSRLATLGETAGGIAHEINNPLNVIVSVAELMKASVERKGHIEKPKLEEYCDRLVKYSMRIAMIINGLRAISRDSAQDPFAEISLVSLTDEALELCQQQFIARNIELRCSKPSHEIHIEGRFAQISQVIINLLTNARDAVEGQSDAKVYLEICESNEQGLIRVWDSGPGVPPELEDKIMNPFFTTKPVGKGTGLGLSISKSIVHEHNGRLYLNRRIANSCFEVVFPLIQGHKNSSDAA